MAEEPLKKSPPSGWMRRSAGPSHRSSGVGVEDGVDAAVGVAGMGVAVGGIGVAVGGTRVGIGGTGVGVGDARVAVAESVPVGVGERAGADDVRTGALHAPRSSVRNKRMRERDIVASSITQLFRAVHM